VVTSCCDKGRKKSSRRDAQIDALEIEVEGKGRLADEHDAAREPGEIAKQGSNKRQSVVLFNRPFGTLLNI
jgi:hypothetical protein